jgi:hypothetical protein
MHLYEFNVDEFIKLKLQLFIILCDAFNEFNVDEFI